KAKEKIDQDKLKESKVAFFDKVQKIKLDQKSDAKQLEKVQKWNETTLLSLSKTTSAVFGIQMQSQTATPDNIRQLYDSCDDKAKANFIKFSKELIKKKPAFKEKLPVELLKEV